MKKITLTILFLLIAPLFAFADGSQTYSTPGTYNFTVPSYGTLTVTVNGAGGGGGGNGYWGSNFYCNARSGASGSSGGITKFDALIAYGGSGGAGEYLDGHMNPRRTCLRSYLKGSAGAAGSTNGLGDTNTVGGGSAGGSGASQGGNGGAGGSSVKTYAAGQLAVGTTTSITVGTGGTGGTSGGAAGTNGSVTISWTDAPSCSVTLTPNPVAYGFASTLTYSSASSTSFYINSVGYVATSGSALVQPGLTTDFTGTVGNGLATTTCPAILVVTPPPQPSATISASSTSIYAGQSTGILATFSPGSGDSLAHDNIDSPEGTGLGATTNPDASKYITFTPSYAGTYTFFARAQTGYFTSWASYASTTITVTIPPSCTPTYTCSGDTIRYTNSICQVSTVTTCVSPAFCSPGSSTCLNLIPAFNSGVSDNGITLTGHLQVAPSLLRSGASTHVYWNTSNVSSCMVTGSNGDSWNGVSSGTSGKTSSNISQQTIYRLSCTGLDGSAIDESATVNILPVFKEL